MAIFEKNVDTYLSINGDHARKYEHAASMLLEKKLPTGWQWVLCSKDAVVAVNHKFNVYYKEFLPRNKFEEIKSIFRGSRCERARRQADILREVGLPTPSILCWGRMRKNVFLISEGFAGVGFFQYIKMHFSPPLNKGQINKKRQLLRETGSLIGEMHSLGITHGDLRQDNLLVKETEEGFQFSFIDNERNRKWLKIPVSKVIKNLAQFSTFFDNPLSRTDLMRIYHAYAAIYPRFSGTRERFFLRNVFSRSQRRILQSRFKNWTKETCQLFDRNNYKGEYVRESIVAQQFETGHDPAHWFLQTKTVLKNDKNISVKLLPGPGGNIIAKRFTANNSFPPRDWFKIKRAQRQWKMSHIFLTIGVHVARPLGFVYEGKGVFPTASYYYSEYLPNTKNLVELSLEIENFHDWLKTKNIIPRLALDLGRLHNASYCHGDTKWVNILADPRTGKFWLIDLDGASQVKTTLDRGVRKDLGRFIVDMIKYGLPEYFLKDFLEEYCRIRMLDKERVEKKIGSYIKKIHKRHKRKKNIST